MSALPFPAARTARAVLDAALSEKDLMAAAVALARCRGWMVYHTFDSRRSVPGFPDVVLVRPPRLLMVELKREGRAPTTAQAEWLEALRLCGVETAVWRPSDLSSGLIAALLA